MFPAVFATWQAVMEARKITVVDLYATMTACGNVTCGVCSQRLISTIGTGSHATLQLHDRVRGRAGSCKPHCGAAGYNYLVDNAIVPAIKKALAA
jgi:hypothetical protein